MLGGITSHVGRHYFLRWMRNIIESILFLATPSPGKGRVKFLSAPRAVAESAGPTGLCVSGGCNVKANTPDRRRDRLVADATKTARPVDSAGNRERLTEAHTASASGTFEPAVESMPNRGESAAAGAIGILRHT